MIGAGLSASNAAPLTNWTSFDLFRGVGVEMLSQFTSPASATWPSANRALLIPILLDQRVTIKKLFCHNGAAVSGNIDLAIYNAGYTRLVSAGSTAQSGTSNLQVVDTTDITLAPGRYWFGVAMDNTTGTMVRADTSSVALRPFGVSQMASAFALPATFTPATVAASYLPLVGFTCVTVI